MTIIRWLVFAWGALASIVMACYAIAWATQPGIPLRNELGIGFGMGMVLGWPAWLGLPLLVYSGTGSYDAARSFCCLPRSCWLRLQLRSWA